MPYLPALQSQYGALLLCADAVALAGHGPVAEFALPILERTGFVMGTWGRIGAVLEGPMDEASGWYCAALGDVEQAEERMERALALSTRLGLPCAAARVRYHRLRLGMSRTTRNALHCV